MMPYDTYRLYQAERVKSSVEIQRADMQAARLVSAVASLFRSIMRPVRAVRRLGPSAVRGSLSAPQVVGTEWLSFQRIVDVPFETCVAALDSWQRTGQRSELRFGNSLLRGPIEHDGDTGTCRIQVRLARGPLRPLLRMRLDIDRWSASSTALELTPSGRVRATADYFRAGHLLLDLLTRSLSQPLPPVHAQDTTSRPHVSIGATRP